MRERSPRPKSLVLSAVEILRFAQDDIFEIVSKLVPGAKPGIAYESDHSSEDAFSYSPLSNRLTSAAISAGSVSGRKVSRTFPVGSIT